MPDIKQPQCLNECQQLILKTSLTLFETFLNQTDEKLFVLADKASSDQDQRRLFEGRQTINKHFTALSRVFHSSVDHAFQCFCQGRSTLSEHFQKTTDRFPGLALVDNEQLEENLALGSMCQKLENRQSEALFALHQRLAVLRGGRKIQSQESPVEPAVFADALQQALSPLQLEMKTRIIVYKLFDQHFMSGVGELYDQLNALLQKAGILPNLRYAVRKQITPEAPPKASSDDATTPAPQPTNLPLPPGPSDGGGSVQGSLPPNVLPAGIIVQGGLVPPGSGPYPAASRGPVLAAVSSTNATPNPLIEAGFGIDYAASAPIQQDLLQHIFRLQQAQQQNREPDTGSSTPSQSVTLVSFDSAELTDTLSHLQQELAEDLEHQGVIAIPLAQRKQQLQQELRRKAPEKRINRLDQDIIELVGMLFEFMLNEEHLPDKAKALLSYLHTPFLKLALIDRDFFEQPNHPARELLNKLVEAGIRWLETENESRSKIYGEMNRIVQIILHEFDNDTSLFAKLALEFSVFISQHERRIRMAEERARQAAKGEDRLREIRRQVEQALHEKIKGIRIPKPIHTLLYEPWASFMQFSLLRYGAGSEQWEHVLSVVEDLLWLLKPKSNLAEKHQAEKLESEIIPRIQSGFHTVGYDEGKAQQLVKSLNLCVRLATAGIIDEQHIEMAPPPAPLPDKVEVDARLKPYLARLEKVDFGAWFVFDTENQTEKRLAKLVWYNAKTNHYMFVNKLGQQVRICSAEELAEQMANGSATLMDSDQHRPFFEKALESILAQMQNNQESR